MQKLRGLRDFIHDMIEKTTDLVQETHESSAKVPRELLTRVPGLEQPVRAVDAVRHLTAELVFDSIRAANRGVQLAEEIGFKAAEKVLESLPPDVLALDKLGVDPLMAQNLADWGSMAQAALNAVAGDFLVSKENELAIPMCLFHRETMLEPLEAKLAESPNLSPNLVLFVHGLGCAEAGFRLFGKNLYGRPDANYGTLLQEELGYSPFYVRYNTGRHISENGRELALKLEALHAAYPMALERIVLVGHSMGGLVVRSAAHYGHTLGHAWVKQLSHVFCLGSPHHGAPLEKLGNVLSTVLAPLEVAGAQVTRKLLDARSPGVKDLRFGNLVDEDWKDGDVDSFLKDTRTELGIVPGVTYCAIASTLTRDENHPVAAIMGDLMVRVHSASGEHEDERRRIPFQDARVLSGLNHVALMNHPAVYAEMKRWLTDAEPAGVAEPAPQEAQAAQAAEIEAAEPEPAL